MFSSSPSCVNKTKQHTSVAECFALLLRALPISAEKDWSCLLLLTCLEPIHLQVITIGPWLTLVSCSRLKYLHWTKNEVFVNWWPSVLLPFLPCCCSDLYALWALCEQRPAENLQGSFSWAHSKTKLPSCVPNTTGESIYLQVKSALYMLCRPVSSLLPASQVCALYVV